MGATIAHFEVLEKWAPDRSPLLHFEVLDWNQNEILLTESFISLIKITNFDPSKFDGGDHTYATMPGRTAAENHRKFPESA